MKTRALFLLCLCLVAATASAQQYFEFPKVSQKERVPHPFQKVVVIDKRSDQQAVARLKFDAAKGYEWVNSSGPFADLLSEFCQKVLEPPATGDQELVIVLYRFFAAETDTLRSDELETGCVRFSADFFVKDSNNEYRILGFATREDCIIAYNITEPLIRLSAFSIIDAYQTARKQTSPSALRFSRAYVEQFDQKTILRSLPFSGQLPDSGYFPHWNDFLSMRARPDVVIQRRANNLGCYRIDSKGKPKKMYNDFARVVLLDGKAYYGLRGVYWEMERSGGSFRVKLPVYLRKWKLESMVPHFSDHMSANMMVLTPFGGFVAAPVVDFVRKYYECEVDGRTGELLLLKELSGPEDCSPHLGLY